MSSFVAARGAALLLCALALAHATAPPADAYTGFEPLDCVACAAGFYLAQEGLNCTACPAGSSTFHYTNASSALHCLCRPGFENASARCEQCRVGFYKEELANASCARCVAHSSTAAAGSANVSACVCDPGFSKPSFAALTPGPEDHARPCEPCAPGSFKRTQADEACLECPADQLLPGWLGRADGVPGRQLGGAGAREGRGVPVPRGLPLRAGRGRRVLLPAVRPRLLQRAGEPVGVRGVSGQHLQSGAGRALGGPLPRLRPERGGAGGVLRAHRLRLQPRLRRGAGRRLHRLRAGHLP
jgi:hypothetical protein